MSWLGAAVGVAAVAAVFVLLARALRKAQHYESWGVYKVSQQWFGGPLPHNLGSPIEIVTEPEEDERGLASTGEAAPPNDPTTRVGTPTE